MKKEFSFRPEERLKKRSQFRNVYKNGRAVKSKNLKLLFLPSDLPYNRLGLSVESRKIPLSVNRARVKRFLKEAFRLNKNLFEKGFDIVIITSAGAKGLEFKDVQEEMLYLVKKAGILQKK